MPDSDGKLTSEEKDKIVNWLKSKADKHVCPVCYHDTWFVADHIMTANVYNSGGIFLGGATYPYAMLVCENCLFTQHFMVVPLGIGRAQESPKQDGEKEKEKAGGGNG